MAAYLQKAREFLRSFSTYTISQILRSQNTKADTLAWLGSAKDTDQLKIILVETLDFPSIQTTKEPLIVNYDTIRDSWMTPVIQYLKDGVLPEDERKAKLLRLKAARYMLYDHQLYKRGFSTPLLKCVNLEKMNHILQEIHEEVCNNHAWGQSLAFKALR